jgi:hypothetical protein
MNKLHPVMARPRGNGITLLHLQNPRVENNEFGIAKLEFEAV